MTDSNIALFFFSPVDVELKTTKHIFTFWNMLRFVRQYDIKLFQSVSFKGMKCTYVILTPLQIWNAKHFLVKYFYYQKKKDRQWRIEFFVSIPLPYLISLWLYTFLSLEIIIIKKKAWKEEYDINKILTCVILN